MSPTYLSESTTDNAISRLSRRKQTPSTDRTELKTIRRPRSGDQAINQALRRHHVGHLGDAGQILKIKFICSTNFEVAAVFRKCVRDNTNFIAAGTYKEGCYNLRE